jgi:ankyrin repeat protein
MVVARLLLERDDIQPNLSDDQGDMPLWWAAFRGHTAIV